MRDNDVLAQVGVWVGWRGVAGGGGRPGPRCVDRLAPLPPFPHTQKHTITHAPPPPPQYRTMRETLVMLSHLDYEDTELQARGGV